MGVRSMAVADNGFSYLDARNPPFKGETSNGGVITGRERVPLP